MNANSQPQNTHFRFAVVMLFSFVLYSCTSPSTNKDSPESENKPDSISTWITAGRNRAHTPQFRRENLIRAYNQATSEESDSLRLSYFSRIQWSFGNLKDSLWFRKTNRETVQIALKLRDTQRLAATNWDLGLFFDANMISDSAYYHLGKAQKLYELSGNNKRAGILYYDIALIQAKVKDYTGSEINLIKAIQLLKPLKENLWLHLFYNQLGINAKDLKDFDNSLNYYDIASTYLNKIENKGNLKSKLQNNIGVTYLEKQEYAKAISYFEKVLKLDSLRYKSPDLYARNLNNLAQGLYLSNQYDAAENIFFESLRIRDSIQDVSDLAGGYFNLAEYYEYRKDTLKAIKNAKKSKDFAQQSNNTSRLLESLALLTKIDHQNAAAFGKSYIALNDSLQQEERNIRNKFARIRFETDEFIAENELLGQQKRLWTGIAAAILLLGLLTFIILTQRNRNRVLKFKQQQQASNEEIFNLMLAQKEKVEEGKKLEQKRVSEELHDGVLGRLLGTRMMLIGLNKRTDTDSITERAKAISILQDVESEVRSISHELSHAAYQKINNFILSIKDLLKTIETSSKINMEFDCADDLDYDALNGDIKINLYRIIQEIIQNAVKHSECSNVSLSFNEDSEFLRVTISDDGKGFVVKKGKKGIGMRNITSRMQKVNGTWNIDSTLGKGTTVTLVIPIVTSDNTSNIRIEQGDLQEF